MGCPCSVNEMFRKLWNMLESGTRGLLGQFQAFLSGMFRDATFQSSYRDNLINRDELYDFVLDCELGGESWRFNVEVKSHAPNSQDLAPLRHRPRGESNEIVLAPYISPAIQRLLEDANLSFWDATGNSAVRVRRPRVIIRTQGAAKNPEPPGRAPRLATLKGRAASRVVLSLFTTPRPASLREIARETGSGLGTVSRVIDLLMREGIMFTDEGGRPRLRQRRLLMARWIEDYSFIKANRARRYVASLGKDQTLGMLEQLRFRYALTGVEAQQRLMLSGKVSVFPSSETWLYLENPATAAEILGLIPVPRGGDFLIADERDSGGLESAIRTASSVVATQWRVAADLLSSPGRERSAGEQLFEQLLLQVQDHENPENW